MSKIEKPVVDKNYLNGCTECWGCCVCEIIGANDAIKQSDKYWEQEVAEAWKSAHAQYKVDLAMDMERFKHKQKQKLSVENIEKEINRIRYNLGEKEYDWKIKEIAEAINKLTKE